MFDKWWTIERMEFYNTQESAIKRTTLDKIAMLDSKKHEPIIEEILLRHQESIRDDE